MHELNHCFNKLFFEYQIFVKYSAQNEILNFL